MNTNGRQSILIVEDVTTDIDLLNHILKNHYTVYIAKTGRAALDSVAELRPDLILLDIVLLDIVLPDMTGFAVLSDLKETAETKEIPVIIITGISNIQYEEKGLMLGAVDYITKPFHNTVVLARIKIHLQLIRYVKTITRLGLIDPVTDLPNHRGFENRIGVEWARAIREKHSLSLLIVDIDGLEALLEKYGRIQGDILLQKIVWAIGDSFHRPADLVARLENDRFAVLLPNTDLKGATLMAEEVRSKMEDMPPPLIDDGSSFVTTVSIGVASAVPEIPDLLPPFLALARQRADRAGELGGNRVIADGGE